MHTSKHSVIARSTTVIWSVAAAVTLITVFVYAAHTASADELATDPVYLESSVSDENGSDGGDTVSAEHTVTTEQTAPEGLPDLRVSCVIDPTAPAVGESVLFAAGSAYGIPPVQYEWSGAVSGTGITQRTVVSSPGTISATVIATDAYGRTATAPCDTTVVEAAPVTQETDDIAGVTPAESADETPFIPAVSEEGVEDDDTAETDVVAEEEAEERAVPAVTDERSFTEGIVAAFTGEGIGTTLLWLIVIIAGLVGGYYLFVVMRDRESESQLSGQTQETKQTHNQHSHEQHHVQQTQHIEHNKDLQHAAQESDDIPLPPPHDR